LSSDLLLIRGEDKDEKLRIAIYVLFSPSNAGEMSEGQKGFFRID
jgi:hypothetical protein